MALEVCPGTHSLDVKVLYLQPKLMVPDAGTETCSFEGSQYGALPESHDLDILLGFRYIQNTRNVEKKRGLDS